MIVLRVGSFPTIEKSGMGLHASKLCEIESLRTIYLTPRELSPRLQVYGDFELIEFDFLLDARPINKSFLLRSFFNLRRVFSLLKFSLYGIWLLFTKKIDMVHIHSPMYILIAFFGFLLRKKVYITFHGSDFYRIEKASWYRMLSFIFSKVFIISPHMRPTLAKIHGNKSVVLVQNGVDLNLYKNYHISRKKQIIAVGALKIEKGFEYLIEAFSNLLSDSLVKHYKLCIVGEGLLRKSLEKQIISLGMSDNIFLLGHKNRSQLIGLYNESEIFVLSSISEGSPKVLLEALSCGCLIVSTDVGAVRSVLPFEPLASPANSVDLEKILLNCIKNGNNSKVELEKFDWESVREKYWSEYQSGVECIH